MSDRSLELLRAGRVRPDDEETPTIIENYDEFLLDLGRTPQAPYPPVPSETDPNPPEPLPEPDLSGLPQQDPFDAALRDSPPIVPDDEESPFVLPDRTEFLSDVLRLAELDESEIADKVEGQVLSPAIQELGDDERAWFDQFGADDSERLSLISQRMVDVEGFADKMPKGLREAIGRGATIFQQAEQLRDEYSWAEAIPAYIFANPKTFAAEVAAEVLALSLITIPEPTTTGAGVALRAGIQALKESPTVANLRRVQDAAGDAAVRSAAAGLRGDRTARRVGRFAVVEGGVSAVVGGTSSAVQNLQTADVREQVGLASNTFENVVADTLISGVLGAAIGAPLSEGVTRAKLQSTINEKGADYVNSQILRHHILKHNIQIDPDVAREVGRVIARGETPDEKLIGKFTNTIKVSTKQAKDALKKAGFKPNKDGTFQIPGGTKPPKAAQIDALADALELDSVRNFRVTEDGANSGDVEYNFDAYPLKNAAPTGTDISDQPVLGFATDFTPQQNWKRIVEAGRNKDGFYPNGNPWLDSIINGEDPAEVINWSREVAEAKADAAASRKEFETAPEAEKPEIAVKAAEDADNADKVELSEFTKKRLAFRKSAVTRPATDRKPVDSDGEFWYVKGVGNEDIIYIGKGDELIGSVSRTPHTRKQARKGEVSFHFRKEYEGSEPKREADITAYNNVAFPENPVMTPRGKVIFRANSLKQAAREFIPVLRGVEKEMADRVKAAADVEPVAPKTPPVAKRPETAEGAEPARPAGAEMTKVVERADGGFDLEYRGSPMISVRKTGDETYMITDHTGVYNYPIEGDISVARKSADDAAADLNKRKADTQVKLDEEVTKIVDKCKLNI